jgi:uncharacterized membrane protein
MNTNVKSGWFKVVIGWFLVFCVRLIPWRMPNVEGVMATLMPASKRFGSLAGFAYGFLAIVLYDLVTGKVGSWTWITGFTYGAIGIASAMYFRNRKPSRANFVVFSVVATVVYDLVTGVLFAPLWDMSYAVAFMGQIPFTGYHLLGNTLFALIVSPAFYRFVVENPRLEFPRLVEAKS